MRQLISLYLKIEAQEIRKVMRFIDLVKKFIKRYLGEPIEERWDYHEQKE